MNAEIKELVVNGITYIPKDSVQTTAPNLEGLPYVIVRTYSAGVFAGYLKSRNGKEVVLLKARRMWFWIGASLSEVAQSGTPEPQNCKFPEEVDEVFLTEAIEILSTTQACFDSIKKVKIWKR